MHEPTPADERDRLLAIVVKALEPYDVPTGGWSDAERREPAQAVLDALGLMEMGWLHDDYGFSFDEPHDGKGEALYVLSGRSDAEGVPSDG